MTEQILALSFSDIWSLCDLSPGKLAIDCKWIFEIETNAKDEYHEIKGLISSERFFTKKRRWISQNLLSCGKMWIDTNDLGVRCARKHRNHKIWHQDNVLVWEFWIRTLTSFTQKESEVYKLHRSLYGLKQSLQYWEQKFAYFLAKFSFKNI